ncbi:EAL domain-containing protein [Marinobacterium sp. AK62]|uniref:EAL domain-containing protein n=1 Tax=Marinobacterium alkalitolerans TaxID=1542925 RepID=A0ABS3Z8J1_9GAMM|nr:EAL domain-containing protein [Marinobacterium alkalitolerans]MBP0048040.1 EAL domain-containing protein [Marinobacterium alkalitolerans]
MLFSALSRAVRLIYPLICAVFILSSQAVAETQLSDGPDFKAVFTEANLPMLLIEPESGRIVASNAASAAFYGYSKQQLESMSIQDINTFTPEQVKAERALAESEGRNYFIFRHRLADGEVRTVEVYSRPYTFDGRSLLYSIINDITPGRHQAADLWHYQERLEQMVDAQVGQIEQNRKHQLLLLLAGLLVQALVIVLLIRNIRHRKELEKQRAAANRALEESRYQLEEAQRIAKVGSWVLDHEKGEMVCSSQMRHILEIDENEDPAVVYRRAWERVHPDDLERLKDTYSNALESASPYDIEHRLLMPDGRVKFIHVRAENRVVDSSGRPMTLGTVQDITRQHVVQDALTALATDYASLAGIDFYRAVCRHLADALGLDYVFVGALSPNHESVDVIAGAALQGDITPFRYGLKGTPCNDVMECSMEVHAHSIQAMFPEDELLQEMGIESYVGSSLLDKQQQPMGILVGLGCRPLREEALAEELFRVFVGRVDAEMQRSQAEHKVEQLDAYREIVLKFSNRFINLSLPEVDDAIQQALHEIGAFIGADSCYLFEYDFDDQQFSMTHEWCVDGLEGWKDRLQGIPLANMPSWTQRHSQGEAIVVPDVGELEERFVADIIRERGLKSFIDQPLMSESGCIGFVGVSSREKQIFDDQTVALLELLAGLLTNIRKRQETEGQLQLSASVFDNADESIMITDPDGKILSVNQAFVRTTGYSAEEAKGQDPVFMNVHEADPDYRDRVWERLKRFGYWKGEVWNRHREGERYAVLQKINAFFDQTGALKGYVSLMSDITTLKHQQHQLERIAHFDALTGLPNRTLLADRMQQAIALANRTHSSVAILFIDLDGFKLINDTHSHAVGDQLLIQVAQRMKEVMRQEDTLARLGGDEFVAVLMNLEQTEDSIPVIRRLLDSVSDPFRVKGLGLRVSASIGVAFYPQQENLDADQLLRQADQAMYQAKQAGKNRYQFFDVERDRALRTQHDSLESIRLAMSNRELVLHFQPKVNMRTGDVIGCEALIRWQHPERGLLPPAAFLPVIENHPIAIEVGEWVLETALDQVLAWRQEGLEIPVSVNIDAIHLQHSEFIPSIKKMLDRRPGIRRGDLELEILETTALEDVEQVSAIIDECSSLGVGFALDDFGTGYSSLTYLKRLPAQMLKIDRSFVRDMLVDPDDLAILKGVIQLAGAFRREVIAEGVETEEHGRELLSLGCDLGQGYAIARPMPADDMPAWYWRWQQHYMAAAEPLDS